MENLHHSGDGCKYTSWTPNLWTRSMVRFDDISIDVSVDFASALRARLSARSGSEEKMAKKDREEVQREPKHTFFRIHEERHQFMT